MNRQSGVAVVLGGLLWAGGVAAAEVPAPADGPRGQARLAGFPNELRSLTNSPGFCLDLGCGDGELAAEIACRTKYTVFALAKDDADCDTTRRLLDQAGVYGTRATAVAGSLRTLPLPNGYGNLIVTGEYRDDLNLKEVFRVLNPNGLAILGGGKADTGRLKAALDAAEIKEYRLVGNYAVFHGRMPEGVDEWTHFGRGPDNIQTSREAGIRPPFRTQWYLARPSYDDKATDHAAIAGGRIICRPAVPKPNPDRYYAFDAFNGTLLWERPVSKSKNNYRYALVDGVYYGTEREQVVALDAATGEKLREYAVPSVTGALWWIAVDNNVLYGLLSTPAMTNANVFGAANLLCAFDVKSGELLWRKEHAVPVLSWTVALDCVGGLFFCDIAAEKGAKQGHGTAYGLDGRTGVERWHSDLGFMKTGYNDGLAAGCLDGKYFVWVCQDAKGVVGTKSFDVKTGQLVRDYPGVRSYAEGFTAALDFIDGKIWCNTTAGHAPYQCYEIATGKKQKTAVDGLRARDCVGHASATCLYAGGEGCCVQDILTGKEWVNPFIRPGDFSSPYPAEGMLFHLPAVCHCPHMFGAPIAMAPAGLDWKPPAVDEDMATRLVTGPAFEQPLAEDGREEWTHYRGTAGHAGEAATAPKLPLQAGWERRLGGRLTPPSFGAGLVFVGSREGVVWALDRGTGEIRWRFLCGASVRVTPSFGRGRLLFGSDDGWIYCLAAQTGKLAWRFRAAPEERYINAEGQMNSLWPSTAGILLDGDIAYGAAGLLSYDGGYLYALEIRTGKAVWAERIGGPDLPNGAPHGIMALAGDTLILPVFAGRLNSAYRKTDGERIAWFKGDRSYWCFGSEALADGDVFFYGGPRHGNDDWRGGHAAYTLMDVKTGWPYGKFGTTPEALAARNIAPVLGKQTILGDGVGYDRKRFCEVLQSDVPGAAKTNAAIWSVNWRDDHAEKTSALLLAGDVALAAGTSEVVACEAKKDGRMLGRVNVAGKILRNSLAASDGDVFVVTEEGGVCRVTMPARTAETIAPAPAR